MDLYFSFVNNSTISDADLAPIIDAIQHTGCRVSCGMMKTHDQSFIQAMTRCVAPVAPNPVLSDVSKSDTEPAVAQGETKSELRTSNVSDEHKEEELINHNDVPGDVPPAPTDTSAAASEKNAETLATLTEPIHREVGTDSVQTDTPKENTEQAAESTVVPTNTTARAETVEVARPTGCCDDYSCTML